MGRRIGRGRQGNTRPGIEPRRQELHEALILRIRRRVAARQMVEDENIPQRLVEIDEEMADIEAAYSNDNYQWLPKGGDVSYTWWTFFESSDWHLLPYAGGLGNQPEWWMDDVAGFNALTRYFDLQEEKKSLNDRLKKRV